MGQKLTNIAKHALHRIDPRQTPLLTQTRCVEGLHEVLSGIPELGKSPGKEWCIRAFRNFDVDKTDQIDVETWCEIIRQYVEAKIGFRPAKFDRCSIEGAPMELPKRLETGGPAAAEDGGGQESAFTDHDDTASQDRGRTGNFPTQVDAAHQLGQSA